MPNYGKTAESAYASILAAGAVMAGTRALPGAYDPSTGEETAIPELQTWELVAVTLPATIARFRGIDVKLTEGLVLGKARYLLTAAKNSSGFIPEPLPEDVIVFPDLTAWKVIGATAIKPAGIPILYQIGVVNADVDTEPAIENADPLWIEQFETSLTD